MNFKAVIFDLDGTLLDTLNDLASSMNSVLARFNFPVHPVDSYRYYVGDGMDTLVRRTLPKQNCDSRTIAKCLKAVKEEYHAHWADSTKPYPGIPQMLTAIQNHSIPMCILSNKPHDFTELTVNKLLPAWSFKVIRGVSDLTPKKPDTAGALQICAELDVPPASVLYLGDTDTDMITANVAGMYPVGVLWGFRTAEELKSNGAKTLLAKPVDILTLLGI